MNDKKRPETILYFSDSSIGFFEHRNGRGRTDIHGNVPLDKGILENGFIVDPVLLLARLKALFKASGLRPRRIRLVLNSQNVVMRVVDVKRSDVAEKGIAAHLDGELGKTLHFPFAKPRVSAHLISQDEQNAKVLAVASDDRLLNDYLDVFDRLGVRDVRFDMPSFALYSLYMRTTGSAARNLMLVTVYDSYFTIKIFEDDIPIFNLVEEFENEADTRYEQIDDYVERVANYYKYNISRGDRTLEKAVFVSQGESENESRFEAAFTSRPFGLACEVFRIPETPTAGGGWNRTSLVAYAAGIEKAGNLAKIPWFDFRLDRPDRSVRLVKAMLATAFLLFSAVSLLYIPYHTMYERIFLVENENRTLAAELSDLEDGFSRLPSFTQAERAYSDAYDELIGAKSAPAGSLSDLLALAIDVDVLQVAYRAADKAIVLTLTGPSDVALTEYLLLAYETYGVTETEDPARWIDGFPIYESIGIHTIEVTFHHA
ncbi:MAG: hypothetical protein WC509_06185 [Candidatus Izemoplasmatales bacterium]